MYVADNQDIAIRNGRARSLRVRAAGASLWSILALMGCTGAKSRPECSQPETIAVACSPRAQLNQDREGNSRSVVVRVYQLTDPRAFDAMSFEEVWLQPERALPSEALAALPEEITLVPGREQRHLLRRSPRATHLALAANFREHRTSEGWKSEVTLPPPGDPCASSSSTVIGALTLEAMNYTLKLVGDTRWKDER